MNPTPRIQFVSPYLDGDYYGKIFIALHHEAKRRNMVLYVVQSLVSFQDQLAFPHRIGVEATDGWLLMTNQHSPLPMAPELLRAIEISGKPIVTIGYREHAVHAHAVVTENRRAAKEAVNHLIRDHGHRRVAYVGSKEHVDLIERFEGYSEALAENGIPYDESIVYITDNAMQPAGLSAGTALLADGMNITAVFAATDLIALGLMETMQEAGMRVPEDIAVIGFDDLPHSAAASPPLTTVRQAFADYALIALERLAGLIRGDSFTDREAYLHTELIQRASCGCPNASAGSPTVDVQRSLSRSNADINSIVQRQYQLAGSWASTIREERYEFERMFGYFYPWGCLALWDEQDDDHLRLVMSQAYSNNALPIPELGTKMPIEQFPPSSWFQSVRANEFVHIHAIRNSKKDWGFIVVIRSIDELIHIPGSDLAQTGFTIAHAALERDDLIRQVRFIAEKLEIVSRTTNDGIWDWNVPANRIEWSIRTHDMLGLIGENVTHEPESFLTLIHPDDKEHVIQAVGLSLRNGDPLKVEFRIVGANEMWIYAAGDTIAGSDGTVARMIGSLTNITEKKIAERRITQLAYHDSLTGLANRQLFQERVQQCIEHADRYGTKFGLLLLDLDRFKSINDSMGHQAGDELLQQVAEWLRGVALEFRQGKSQRRERSMAGRLGGDEFIVLLDEIEGESDLQEASDRIQQRFGQPFKLLGQAVDSACSIGYAVYPDDGGDIDALARSADMRMYHRKESNRSGENR
jgi:diguanylate cyclase (GGDEF)-like protein